MRCDAFWLPNLVVTDADTIQMLTLQVRVGAEDAGVGVSQLAAKPRGFFRIRVA